jgi:hypothetical protein
MHESWHRQITIEREIRLSGQLEWGVAASTIDLASENLRQYC